MGISGLLQHLKEIHNPIHLNSLKNTIIGVDAYVWLHKGAFGCAYDLCLQRKTTKYIDYCMRQVKMLQDHGIKPILVFDGDYLPMKKAVENDRREKREETLRKGKELLASGNGKKAIDCFQTCVQVTTEMAYELIKVLKKSGIEFVVAPYEADAQLAYLALNGFVDYVLTEDSDLLVFGCPKVIFKLDKFGNGILIENSNFGSIKDMRFWNLDRFRQMCILSGCDYLKSPLGIGIKKATKLLHRKDAYTVINLWLQLGASIKAPTLEPNYLENYKKADATFLYQRVYDMKGNITTLQPIPGDLGFDSIDFLGPFLDSEVVKMIACGDIDPITKLPFNSDTVSVPLKQNNENLDQVIIARRSNIAVSRVSLKPNISVRPKSSIMVPKAKPGPSKSNGIFSISQKSNKTNTMDNFLKNSKITNKENIPPQPIGQTPKRPGTDLELENRKKKQPSPSILTIKTLTGKSPYFR